MRDGAREMFDFPAPELPRKPRRKDLSAEEQEAADMEDEVAERKIKMKQNFALKLARDTAAYRASVADKLAGEMMRIRAHACAISRAAARPARRPSAIAVSRPLPEA